MKSTNGHSRIRNTVAEFKATERGVEIPPQKGIEVEGVSVTDYMDITIEGTSKVGSDNILYDAQGRAMCKLDEKAYNDYKTKKEKNKKGIDR